MRSQVRRRIATALQQGAAFRCMSSDAKGNGHGTPLETLPPMVAPKAAGRGRSSQLAEDLGLKLDPAKEAQKLAKSMPQVTQSMPGLRGGTRDQVKETRSTIRVVEGQSSSGQYNFERLSGPQRQGPPPITHLGDKKAAKKLSPETADTLQIRQEHPKMQQERTQVKQDPPRTQHDRTQVRQKQQQVEQDHPQTQHDRSQIEQEQPVVQQDRKQARRKRRQVKQDPPQTQHERQEIQQERLRVEQERLELQQERLRVEQERQKIQQERLQIQQQRQELQQEQPQVQQAHHLSEFRSQKKVQRRDDDKSTLVEKVALSDTSPQSSRIACCTGSS